MKFEKDVAHIKITWSNEGFEHHTYSAFRLNVKEFAENIMSLINKGNKTLNLDGIYVETEEVESFEILNYDELWELYLERRDEEDESE